jgi:hypothetical protein
MAGAADGVARAVLAADCACRYAVERKGGLP